MTAPPRGPRVVTAGEPLERARAAMILVHGRGASAEDIMALGPELSVPGFAYLAPQAPGGTWYPNRYSDPLADNQPWLDSALELLAALLAEVGGCLPASRVALLGFSQGACLALEFAARRPRRYGAVVGLSGALIGPPGTAREVTGSLAGTPVFLGCSDVDPHVLAGDVGRSAKALQGLGAEVSLRFYRGLGHTINADEVAAVRELMEALAAAGPGTAEAPG